MPKLPVAISDPQDGDALVYDAASHAWINISATIHNWFPDGAISDDALIDTEGAGTPDKLWIGNRGTEVLGFVDDGGDGGGGAATSETSGDHWNEGINAADWADAYGCGNLPAGVWRIGVSVKSDPALSLYLEPATAHGSQEVGLGPKAITTVYQRFLFTVTTTGAGPIGFNAILRDTDNPDAENPIAATFSFAKLMVSQGDPSSFADGDSPGWSWSGTAHASASSGPQP